MTTPFACVFLAFLLIYLPRVLVASAQAKQPEGYDNRHPRDQQARLEGWGRRANAAHANSFEAFAPFAASVFVSHLGKANETYAAALAVGFVLARLIYIGCYVANWGAARSLVWMSGFAMTVGLFVLPWITG